MDAKTLFFRNLSSAIAKRFNTPFAGTTRQKRDVVSELMKKHFLDDEKTEINSPLILRAESSKADAARKEKPKLNQKRTAELEQKIKKAADPDISSKRMLADLLLKKITLLERTLQETSMPFYDKERIQKMIFAKKKELTDMRIG